MDQWWNKLPLFVIFLLLGNASGFKGGAYSNAHHQWGQPSDNAFSPHAVQSSVSEVPVSGILPEVGSSLFTNRPLKSLNFLKFVKGGVSNRLESMSYAQTAPSSSILASLPLPLNEQLAGSLTLLHGSSGSTITDTASISSQGESTSFPAVLGTSDLSTSNQSSPSLYMSSSQETSGAKSIEANLPVFSQGSVLYNSSSASGTTSSSQGSHVPLSEGSGQSISPQGESSYSGLSQSQGASDTPDKLSSSFVSSQSTSDQSTPSLYSLSSQSSSGNVLEASGSSFQVDLSPQSQETSNQLLPSPLEVSSQSSNGQSTPSLFMVNTDSQSTGLASPPDIQSSLSQSILSTLTQGSASTSQGSFGTELSGSSGQLIPTQVERGSYRGVSQSLSTSSRHAPGSLKYSNFGALPVGVSSQYTGGQSSPSVSTSTQSRSGTRLMTSSYFFPVKGGSHSTSTLSLKPQGIVGMYAPASSAKYVSFPMSSHQAVYHSSGAQFGTYTGFASQGTSSTYSGSVQPQSTTSQFAPGSPSSYPSVSSSPQGAASQSASLQSSRKQFTSRYGTVSGSSSPFSLQGSTTYGGSLQPQGTKSQFASGSPSSYPSVSLSSPQGSAGQSAAVKSSRKQFTSRYGTVSGSSSPFSLQGSTTYGGSLQPQATTSQFVSGSPSSYPSVSSSPQGAASQSATVQSSRKRITSRYGTLSGSSTPFSLQGSTTYGGAIKPQGTTSQFASGSSSYPSSSLSSPQGAASQSAAVVQSSRKQFTSRYGTVSGSSTPFSLQESTSYGGAIKPQGTTSQFASGSSFSYPSVSLSSAHGAASQSATVQSSRKQFTSRYGTMSGSSTPFSLQESTTYGGAIKPQATTRQFASGSPSSPQGPAGQSAAVQSSRKQFTSSYDTVSGSSSPFNLQGSTTYGGSLQPQATTSQFASGSPSSYPSVSLSSPQGAASQSATVESSRKQFTSRYGTVSGSSTPFSLQGSTTYGGSLQPQGTTSQFASGSSSYPSASLSSPQGSAGQSATVQSSQKQFTSPFTGSTTTSEGSSTPFNLQGSTTYGGAIKPQGTTSQLASGSSFSYPSVSLSSTHGAASQSATVQSSRKQFTSSYGTVSGSSTPFSIEGSTTYGGSLKPQATTRQFASGSPSSPQGLAGQSAAVQSSRKQFTSSYDTASGSSTPFSLQGSTTYGGSPKTQATSSQFSPASPFSYNCNCVSLSSPQDVTSVSATVQSLQKQFTSSYGSHSQSGSSTPFSLQGTTTYGGSLQPQATTSQFAPASPSYNCHCAPLSLPQDVASQSNQASQSQKSQRWKISQGIQTSGAVASQGSYLSQSSPMQSRFSSLASAGGSSDSGQFVSAQDGSTSYGGLSQRLSSKYTPESHAYAKLGSSPISISSQSTSNLRSNGLYSSDSLRTQGRFGVVKRLSSQAHSDSPIGKKISERFVPLQRLTGSNRAPFLGLSSQASSVGMFSGIPQTAQALRESGSDVQLYNQLFLKPLLRQGLRDSTKTAS